MEWQPIETAPKGKLVLCGRWRVFNDRVDWEQSSGNVWERGWFGLWKRDFHGREYSHWKHLPEPPEVEV